MEKGREFQLLKGKSTVIIATKRFQKMSTTSIGINVVQSQSLGNVIHLESQKFFPCPFQVRLLEIKLPQLRRMFVQRQIIEADILVFLKVQHKKH